MDHIFLTINAWMNQGLLLGGLGCFLWGMVSVLFSPCHLASIPLIVSYVAGQHQIIAGRKAALYAVLFTIGLFITIATIGFICAVLGRMLGDVGPYMNIIVGMLLLWVSLDILGIAQCSMSNGLLTKIKVKGMGGAFVLGLAYGILSGSCTFGFIAPILAIITIQQKILTGIIFILLFGLGHCIPIAIAGSSAALVKQFLANTAWQQGSVFFRKFAGLCIGLLGVYFLTQPLIRYV
jgi:cytochrome c-type biogenesis protein